MVRVGHDGLPWAPESRKTRVSLEAGSAATDWTKHAELFLPADTPLRCNVLAGTMSDDWTRSEFLFIIAQPESKPLLCEELRREHPTLHLAYSRPGLYTFKQTGAPLPADFELRSIFGRHYGVSLGMVQGPGQIPALLEGTTERFVVHVFARDPGEGRPRAVPSTIAACQNEVKGELSQRCAESSTPRVGDCVLDVVLPADPREPWFVGYHRHQPTRSPHPGSVTRKDPPTHAPSRAWSKLEEVLEWGALPMSRGETALEIGCAPGGAVVSMLDRGLRVVGVDPAAVDPGVFIHAREIHGDFTHIARPCGALARDDLPRHVDWLLCDANLAPQVAFRYLAHLSKLLRPTLRGVIFTMKFNDQRVVQSVPRLIARMAELGLGHPRAVQLPSHRQEIAVFARRPKRAERR